MLKKILSIAFVILMFAISAVFFIPHDKTYSVLDVKSPTEIVLDSGIFKLEDLDSFDSAFTEHNRRLAKKLDISEEEAFVLGNLSKYQTSNLLKGRKVYIKENDLIFFKYSYRDKFLYSGYCIKNSEPFYKDGFETRLKEIRRAKYEVLDLDTDNVYELTDSQIRTLKNCLVIRKSHLPKIKKQIIKPVPTQILDKGFIKIFFADSTTKLKPDRTCSSSICKEILTGINNSRNTIDMAVYGYSRVPAIENALKSAKDRGVKIRLVYDSDQKGGNIYDATDVLAKLIPQNMNDFKSPEAANIMHNKFYIFDDKILITGSANLSHTDMSGFNTNSIVVINSEEAAKIYKTEFEQMLAGNFHTVKQKHNKNILKFGNTELQAYFSPQDKSITNGVLPLIKNAKKYIYIPTFVLTERRVTEELINAKNRGVDVKIIIDALNASNKHSKHKLLRENGILVKTENYAGKMHSKSMIVDDKYTIIGSMNFSYSGENKNDENLIIIKDSEVAMFYKNFFLYQWSKIDDKWLRFNARAEGKDSIGSCSDGIDNNYDGFTDMDDSACK